MQRSVLRFSFGPFIILSGGNDEAMLAIARDLLMGGCG
jgi:hypothetical protein